MAIRRTAKGEFAAIRFTVPQTERARSLAAGVVLTWIWSCCLGTQSLSSDFGCQGASLLGSGMRREGEEGDAEPRMSL